MLEGLNGFLEVDLQNRRNVRYDHMTNTFLKGLLLLKKTYISEFLKITFIFVNFEKKIENLGFFLKLH